MNAPLLYAEDLHLAYGSTSALAGASVAVDAGELVAIMGRSGSGKSTLLHCLAGLLTPSRGAVVFDGKPLSELSDRRRSSIRLRSMGFVFQFADLVPELSLVENVALPLLVTGARRRDSFDRAREVLARVDLAELASRRPGQVSGGQLQRAAIARSLVHRPAIVFADEPTGALDSVNSQLTLEALTQAARQDGTAVVLVTHEARLASYCDREIVIRDGRVGELVSA